MINERPPEVLAQFLAHEADGLGISAITASELYWGVGKSGSRRNLQALEKFLAPLHVMDFGLEAAQACGQLRAELERKGTPIGPLDAEIAAHAPALELTLVTNNQCKFQRVAGLRLENWA